MDFHEKESESIAKNSSVESRGSEAGKDANKRAVKRTIGPGAAEVYDEPQLQIAEIPIAPKSKKRRANSPPDSKLNEIIKDIEIPATSNLTLTNVRSIIYNVVKDADVQKMLANTLQEDSSKLQPATYEPKMTRSKMRQYLEKEGNLSLPWLTPIKGGMKNKQNFTDLDFPEDDDDEDYNPETDIANLSGIYSDDDNESVLSSQISDVGSPMCSKLSPQVNQVPALTLPIMSVKHDNLPQTIDCMGPPPPIRTSKETEKRFLDALDKLDLSDTIAGRTRSRLPLTDTTIDSIEAEFVPPDSTLDMYVDPDVEDEDPEWKSFLANLFKNDLPTEDEDDPEADPEYNVLAEPENEEDHILPVRVPKTEISSLLDELYEAELEDEETQDTPATFNIPKPISKPRVSDLLRAEKEKAESSKPMKTVRFEKPPEPALPVLSLFERMQLQRQMEVFVQMLTQQAIVGSRSSQEVYTQSTHFVRELHAFSSASRAKDQSSFNVANLLPAMQLIDGLTMKQDDDKQEQHSDQQDMKDCLLVSEMSTFITSPVFMYPEYLPVKPFNHQRDSRRSVFQHGEDVLICMGLDEFKSDVFKEHKKTYLIHKYMLPSIKPDSIQMRINNECKTKKNGQVKTTIGRYRKEGVVPAVLELLRLARPEEFVAPIFKPLKLCYPTWVKNTKYSSATRTLHFWTNTKAKETTSVQLPVTLAAPVTYSTTVITLIPQTIPSESQNNATVTPICSTTSSDGAKDGTSSSPKQATDLPAVTQTQESDQVEIQEKTNPGSESNSTDELIPTKTTELNESCETESDYVEGPQDDHSVIDRKSPSRDHGGTDAISDDTSRKEDHEPPPTIINLLADLTTVMKMDEKSSESPPQNIVLVTPAKRRVMTSIYRDNTTPQKIAPSSHITPEKDLKKLEIERKKRNNSPRRQELRQKAQSIVPKSFVPTIFMLSPTKKVAKALTEKALNRVTLKTKYQSPIKSHQTSSNTSQAKPQSATQAVQKSPAKSNRTKKKSNMKSTKEPEDEFAALIEASCTVSHKATRKHRYIACLATDIVETDPKKTEREDLISKWYVNKVKTTLGEDSEQYTKFLQSLINFGKQRKNPSEFYSELKDTLFKDHEDLLLNFAAFLLPAQAVSCGEKCYRACVEFTKARKFLRKVEVYFGANSKPYNKLIKTLTNYQATTQSEWRESMLQILKTHPLLLEDFNSFFPDAKPPIRHKDDYEEMDLTELDDEAHADGYEEMEIPEIEETNATPQCKCQCHSTETNRDLKNKLSHCESCRIAILHGRIFLHAGPKKGLKPAYIRYLNPVSDDKQLTADSEEDDDSTSDIGYDSPAVGSDGISPSPGSMRTSTKDINPSSTSSRSLYSDGLPWTRDEDQLILEALQQGTDLSLSDAALLSLSKKLPNRSVQEISTRFEYLLTLLCQELNADSDSDSSRSEIR